MSERVVIGIACLTFSGLILGFFIWLDYEPAHTYVRKAQDVPARVMEAQRQIRKLFRESHRRMDRIAGKRDDFHFGPWGDW